MYRGGVPPLPKPSVVVTNSRSFNDNGSRLRLYHVWKGSNKFFCGGRLVFGPDFRSLYLTIALIVCPVILFCAFVAPRLVNYFPHHQGYAIVILCASFTVYLIVLVIITSGSDPGIIPRNLQPPEPEDDIYSTSTDWTSQVGLPYLPPTKEVPVNGMIIRVKYCQTCMLYRPPRCSHCSICNNCVERFDHHCPWVGQCIGKRNYRFFFMFVSSTSLLCVYVFAFCCVNIKFISKAYNCSMWRAVSKSPVSGVLIIYTFVASWFVGGLTAFHFYLICTNQTTYENFRYRYDRKRNPYNLGCPRNLKEILFSKIPVSKNNFRAKVTGNLSSILSTSSSARTMSPEMQKAIFDANTGKRQAVDAEEIDDIQNRIGSMRGLDRCGTQTRPNIIWEKNSETETSSMHTIPAKFRFEHHELQ